MNNLGKAIVGLEMLLGCIGCSTKAINTDGKPQKEVYQTENAYSVKPKIDSIKDNYVGKINNIKSEIDSLFNVGNKAREVRNLYGRLYDLYVSEAEEFITAAKKEQRFGHRKELIDQAIGSYLRAREYIKTEKDAQRIQELRGWKIPLSKP